MRRERWKYRVIEQVVLISDECSCALMNRGELLRHAHSVGPASQRAEFKSLLQTRNSNLEKFIQIGAGDTEESNALEKRQRFVVCLREHTAVEIEKRKFPIDVVLRRFQLHIEHARRRCIVVTREYYGPAAACVTGVRTRLDKCQVRGTATTVSSRARSRSANNAPE
jgi:hypothetical protein